MRKTFYIFGACLALFTLVVFATGVVSDWNHYSPTDDGRCPYCLSGHNVPSHLESAPQLCLLRLIVSLPLPEVLLPVPSPVFSQTAPRAPPA